MIKLSILERYQCFLEQRQALKIHRSLPTDSNVKLSFASNDTLGLRQHPVLMDASIRYTQRYGASNSGSRLLCDNQSLYLEVEQKLSKLNQRPEALLFASGFQANVSVIAALLSRQVLKQQALVFTDKLIHASMQLGCQLSRCQQVRFHHQDLNHLEQRLIHYQDDSRPKFILVESLYGMEGTITDLKRVASLAKAHQAFLYVDEAHAFGLYGPGGGGFSARIPEIDLVLGTFSKALGSFGGFITCSSLIKDYLINHCSGLIYTTGLPPSVLGAQKAALDLISSFDQQRNHVYQLSRLWSELNTPASMDSSLSHINIVAFQNVENAKKSQHFLQQNGIKVSLIRPPTVPTSRLRISFNANHSKEDLLYLHSMVTQTIPACNK